MKTSSAAKPMMDAETRELYRLKADIVQAVAHPIRLAIVDFLIDGEKCVCDIAEHVGAQRSNVSRHLAVMRTAGVLGHRKDGLRMLYSLRTPCIVNFIACITATLRERFEAHAAALKRL